MLADLKRSYGRILLWKIKPFISNVSNEMIEELQFILCPHDNSSGVCMPCDATANAHHIHILCFVSWRCKPTPYYLLKRGVEALDFDCSSNKFNRLEDLCTEYVALLNLT